MNEKLQKISQLTHKFPIVIPPGPYFDYPKSSITYLVSNEDGNELLADNPYIFEYLLYNDKKDLLNDVSHLYYVGSEAIFQSKSNSSNFVFFYDLIAHLLDFEISKEELPVFKIFLDHLAFHRKNAHKNEMTAFFPWKHNVFEKYAESVTHSLTKQEISNLHQRLCRFHREFFPEEAFINLF